MTNILLVESSPRGEGSKSNQAARALVDALAQRHPEANVVVRDLAVEPPPHVDAAFVAAIGAKPEQRTPEQAAALVRSEALIEELAASDVLVLAAAVHNFGIPSPLKAWVDHVVRAGRTFQYTAEGPRGLLENKRAILVLASGGVFSAGPYKSFDFHETYLRAVLGLIGIREVEVVRVEGMAVPAIGEVKALAAAAAQTEAVLQHVA